MQQLVGYKLENITTGEVIDQWGGTWGQCPGIPNPIMIPEEGGTFFFAHDPKLGDEYLGHHLVEWYMDEPPPYVPSQIPLWAAKVVLNENGLLDQADAIVANANNRTLTLIWEYGNFLDRNSPLLATMADTIGLSNTQLDTMFITANSLTV